MKIRQNKLPDFLLHFLRIKYNVLNGWGHYFYTAKVFARNVWESRYGFTVIDETVSSAL
jgi:hypothetical protein